MVDVERIVRDLTKQMMTPQFVAEIDGQIKEGWDRTARAAMAMDEAGTKLTDEENQLADQYEEMIISQGEVSSENPVAREAFEKRAKLIEEVIQKG